MLTAYVIEYFKGARTLKYLGVFNLFLTLPLIICYLFYRKDRESKQIKYIVLVGFSIFYTFILFTTSNIYTSVFIIPMIIITQMYQDKRLSFRIGLAAIIINTVSVLYNILYLHKLDAKSVQNYEVQLASLILVCIYNYISTSVLFLIKQI